ncbi:MAG: lysozyme [Pseudomonadota bacterium]
MTPELKRRLIAAGIAAAVPLTMSAEGLVRRVYLDPVGIPTFCFGETRAPQAGRNYTEAECSELLGNRLLEIHAGISRCVRVERPEHERAAHASFAYNVGVGAFCRSSLVRKLNAGDHAGACAEMSRWVYATKLGVPIKLPGLVKRRAEERALCEGRGVPA